ncbi:MAG: putative photosynthetic complex assembly protein PuhE [Pseudomonadota bacterium]
MSVVWAIMLALGLWWLTTILMLWRLRLPRKTFARTFLLTSATCGVATAGFWLTLDSQDVFSAYVGFAAGLAFWCWHEATYFLGYLTGPRPESCPDHVGTVGRFGYGVGASLYHELALIVTAVLLLWLSADAANPLAAVTFCVLWIMRWSSKINIFFGVRNLHLEFWPQHLQYLGSYVGASATNRFYPVSIVLAVGLGVWAVNSLTFVLAPGYTQVAITLTLTMLALACLEHLFLLVRVPDQMLWRWGLIPMVEGERASARAALVNHHRTDH